MATKTVSHTPGPWYAECPRVHWRVKSTAGAYVMEAGQYAVHAKADAYLIAAAPDLFAACRDVRDWLESFSVPPTSMIAEKELAVSRLNAVIAKAEGR